MKILHLIYTKAIAGAEKYLLNLLPLLKQHDIECHLICVCPQSCISEFTAYYAGLNTMQVKTTLIAGSKKDFLSISKIINNYLKKEKISIVHSHLSNADILAVLVKKIYNKRIFIISSKHGYDENYLIKYPDEQGAYKIDKNVYYYFTKFLLKNIDVNLATSRAIADLYFNIKLTPKPFHYIHHGIYKPAAFDIATDKVPYQLIIIGRLEKVKGHSYLINAMTEVVRQFPDARLYILGEGSEKENLQQQVSTLNLFDRVFFMGFHVNPYTYILQSEIIIQPSLFESFGLVYIEAFALKVPVIAFDAPAANEIITDNVTGILVPKYDYEILAQKIIHLLKSPEEQKRIKENAYKRFVDYYSAERMAAETAAWYKSLNIQFR